MSLHSYHYSRKLLVKDPPFYALIMCAIAKADTENLKKITQLWPAVVLEYKERYSSPLGILPSDEVEDIESVKQRIQELEI